MPSSRLAVRMLMPCPPKTFRTMGTMVVMPKKPYTTLGTPAIRAIKGCSTFSIFFGQNRAM